LQVPQIQISQKRKDPLPSTASSDNLAQDQLETSSALRCRCEPAKPITRINFRFLWANSANLRALTSWNLACPPTTSTATPRPSNPCSWMQTATTSCSLTLTCERQWRQQTSRSAVPVHLTSSSRPGKDSRLSSTWPWTRRHRRNSGWPTM